MNVLVVTTCSNRKRRTNLPSLTAEGLPMGPVDEVASNWITLLRGAETVQLTDLYCGRGFQVAMETAKTPESLYIISAGIGLNLASSSAPSYSLTVTRGKADCVLDKLVPRVKAAQWWRSLTKSLGQPNPFYKMTKSNPERLICIACSSIYLSMIQSDLIELPLDCRNRIRLFGPQDTQYFDPIVCSLIMPYNQSFDGPDSPIPGTKCDLAQRALQHFVLNILPINTSISNAEEHAETVKSVLAHFRLPGRQIRQKKSDTDITETIQNLYDSSGGNSRRMLRLLRDQYGIACEQGRFSKLFNNVKENIRK